MSFFSDSTRAPNERLHHNQYIDPLLQNRGNGLTFDPSTLSGSSVGQLFSQDAQLNIHTHHQPAFFGGEDAGSPSVWVPQGKNPGDPSKFSGYNLISQCVENDYSTVYHQTGGLRGSLGDQDPHEICLKQPSFPASLMDDTLSNFGPPSSDSNPVSNQAVSVGYSARPPADLPGPPPVSKKAFTHGHMVSSTSSCSCSSSSNTNPDRTRDRKQRARKRSCSNQSKQPAPPGGSSSTNTTSSSCGSSSNGPVGQDLHLGADLLEEASHPMDSLLLLVPPPERRPEAVRNPPEMFPLIPQQQQPEGCSRDPAAGNGEAAWRLLLHHHQPLGLTSSGIVPQFNPDLGSFRLENQQQKSYLADDGKNKAETANFGSLISSLWRRNRRKPGVPSRQLPESSVCTGSKMCKKQLQQQTCTVARGRESICQIQQQQQPLLSLDRLEGLQPVAGDERVPSGRNPSGRAAGYFGTLGGFDKAPSVAQLGFAEKTPRGGGGCSLTLGHRRHANSGTVCQGGVMPNPDDILPKEAWTDLAGQGWPKMMKPPGPMRRDPFNGGGLETCGGPIYVNMDDDDDDDGNDPDVLEDEELTTPAARRSRSGGDKGPRFNDDVSTCRGEKTRENDDLEFFGSGGGSQNSSPIKQQSAPLFPKPASAFNDSNSCSPLKTLFKAPSDISGSESCKK